MVVARKKINIDSDRSRGSRVSVRTDVDEGRGRVGGLVEEDLLPQVPGFDVGERLDDLVGHVAVFDVRSLQLCQPRQHHRQSSRRSAQMVATLAIRIHHVLAAVQN